MEIKIVGSIWEFIWKIIEWFKVRKAEKRAEVAERTALNATTIADQQADIQKVRDEHKEAQDEIKDLKDAKSVADSFNNM